MKEDRLGVDVRLDKETRELVQLFADSEPKTSFALTTSELLRYGIASRLSVEGRVWHLTPLKALPPHRVKMFLAMGAAMLGIGEDTYAGLVVKETIFERAMQHMAADAMTHFKQQVMAKEGGGGMFGSGNGKVARA